MQVAQQKTPTRTMSKTNMGVSKLSQENNISTNLNFTPQKQQYNSTTTPNQQQSIILEQPESSPQKISTFNNLSSTPQNQQNIITDQKLQNSSTQNNSQPNSEIKPINSSSNQSETNKPQNQGVSPIQTKNLQQSASSNKGINSATGNTATPPFSGQKVFVIYFLLLKQK